MGHIRLGDRLSRTRKWGEVVKLIEADGQTADIASATFDASQGGLARAAKDEGFSYVVWLLTRIPLAARGENFAENLRQAGLDIPDSPKLIDIVSSFTNAVDQHIRKSRARTDFSEMAQMAASASLTALGTKRTQSLFETTPEDVQRAFRSFSTTKQFGILARDFFARFTNRYLKYFLSREMSNHVGLDNRFKNIDQHSEFNRALDLHCREASKIVETFSGGWFSKTEWESGITPEKAKGFLHVALKKLQSEFEMRGHADE